MKRRKSYLSVILLVTVLLAGAAASEATLSYGRVGAIVRIDQLSFYPDTLSFPGDSFAVLVVQNREDAPIQHEVSSRDLFRSGTLVSVQGTGTVEYSNRLVSRVLLSPGEEVVIWFYAEKGRTYSFQCDLNGHAMKATIEAF